MKSQKKKKEIKTPNRILYFLAFILVYPLLRLIFKITIDYSNYISPKGPCVVLCNHQSYMDFLLVMFSLYPRRLNAVAAQKFFFIKPLNIVLPLMGGIPKNLFEPDARSVLHIIKIIKRGDSLLLFPEGRISTDGTYAGIHKATGKLIKKLGVPVVSCNIEGAYVCMPFWRKGFRAGKERVTLCNLLSSEEINSLSVDEINARIDDKLVESNSNPVKKTYYVFRPNQLTQGLENILYLCPACNNEFTTQTSGNDIWCTVCKRKATMDRYAIFSSRHDLPRSVQEWYKIQVEHEMQSLFEDMKPIIIPVDVSISSAEAKGLEATGRGELSLDCKGWYYNGEINGEKVNLFFSVETVPALPFDPNINFQIYSKGKYHAFTPYENKRACVKYSILGECAYHKFNTDVQMTKSIID